MLRFLGIFTIVALAVVSAETYSIQLFRTIHVGSTELKAGDYRLEQQGNKIVIKNGRISVEASVTVENLTEKVPSTRLALVEKGDQLQLASIWLRGTKTKLVLQ